MPATCSYCGRQSIFCAPLTTVHELDKIIENAKECPDCKLLIRAVEHFASRLLLSNSHPKRAWHIHPYGSHTFALGYTDSPGEEAYTDWTRELPIFFYLDPGWHSSQKV